MTGTQKFIVGLGSLAAILALGVSTVQGAPAVIVSPAPHTLVTTITIAPSVIGKSAASSIVKLKKLGYTVTVCSTKTYSKYPKNTIAAQSQKKMIVWVRSS